MIDNYSRYFNNINIISDSIIRKSSKQTNKIIAEYRWLETQNIFNHPSVYNIGVDGDLTYYDMDYIHGSSLSYLYKNKLISLENFKTIFIFLKNKIYENKNNHVKLYKQRYRDLAKSMYVDKTIKRLSNYGIDLDTEYIINGIKQKSLKQIISKCTIDVCNSDICYIHGDLCFSNIILDNYALMCKDLTDDILAEHMFVIDPRGILYNNEISAVGDYRYDIAKLCHSAVGFYDLIKSDKYNINTISKTEFNVCKDTYIDDYTISISNIFREVFDKEFNDTIIICIHLFLSMIPLHIDNPSHQNAMLITALNLYNEYVD